MSLGMATDPHYRLLTAEEFLRIDFGPDLKAELDDTIAFIDPEAETIAVHHGSKAAGPRRSSPTRSTWRLLRSE